MLQTETKIADFQRHQATHRKSQHGQLVNRILMMGDVFNFEKINYWAFQRRYGKSVGRRAPGSFVQLLRRKAVSALFLPIYSGLLHRWPDKRVPNPPDPTALDLPLRVSS
jgi:hypothetical protein